MCSYTGVYAERFRSGDGRINGESDNRLGRRYLGSTNTGGDEVIHDISVLMRSNMSGGSQMRYPLASSMHPLSAAAVCSTGPCHVLGCIVRVRGLASGFGALTLHHGGGR